MKELKHLFCDQCGGQNNNGMVFLNAFIYDKQL